MQISCEVLKGAQTDNIHRATPETRRDEMEWKWDLCLTAEERNRFFDDKEEEELQEEDTTM